MSAWVLYVTSYHRLNQRKKIFFEEGEAESFKKSAPCGAENTKVLHSLKFLASKTLRTWIFVILVLCIEIRVC